MPSHDDWIPAPNIGRHPDTYEQENEALARDGRLDAALREVADWSGRRLLDVGCGTGFWLPRYAEANEVVGIEPDPALLARAQARVADIPHVSARPGSAESPDVDGPFDVVHARFAYFFGAGAEVGLAAIRRLLAPGGVFIAVDNSWSGGDFAELLHAATTGNASHDPDAIAAWWAEQGAERHEVRAGWSARSAEELERILRIEFPGPVIDDWVASHPDAHALSYRMLLYVVRSPPPA